MINCLHQQHQSDTVVGQVMALLQVLNFTFRLPHITYHHYFPCILTLAHWGFVLMVLVPPWGHNFLPFFLPSVLSFLVFLFPPPGTSNPDELVLDPLLGDFQSIQVMVLDLAPPTLHSPRWWNQIIIGFYLRNTTWFCAFIFFPTCLPS